MTKRAENPMGALVRAALHVLQIHDPGDFGHCLQPECIAAGLPGRCLPHRIADEVVSAWAHHDCEASPAVVGPDGFDQRVRDLAPGESVISPVPVTVVGANGQQKRYPAGTRVLRTGTKHPAWCMGLSCGEQDSDHTHIGRPDQVANVLVTLMRTDGEPPVITLTDVKDEEDETATVVVAAADARNLAQVIRMFGQRAAMAG